MKKNIVTSYLSASIEELRKVTWPTKEQVARLTVITIVFSLVMAAIYGAFDYGLAQGFNWLITKF
jgi:preprotein translocase SecE subunit